MLGSSILDVAIGMAFIYLLLSLIASTIQEAIASVVQSRSANLERGIRSLFSGGQLLNGQYLLDTFYRHGLIRGLYRDDNLEYPEKNLPPRKSNPVRCLLRRLLGIHTSEGVTHISDPFLLPAYIPARTFSIAMMDILTPTKDNGKGQLQNIEEHLQKLLATDTAPPTEKRGGTYKMAEAILALVADANTSTASIDRFRWNLENWYNDAMDRTSGWYKKKTQTMLLVIGILLAVIFNVDSIHVGQTLWFDKDARQGLISSAATYLEKNTPHTESDGAVIARKVSEEELAAHMKTTVRAFNKVSEDYLLPVGWRYSLADYRSILSHPEDWRPIHIAEQLAGWIITAFALSLGAPFWFDILNKFMVVRSTVKPQEKSKNESSKDG